MKAADLAKAAEVLTLLNHSGWLHKVQEIELPGGSLLTRYRGWPCPRVTLGWTHKQGGKALRSGHPHKNKAFYNPCQSANKD